MCSEARIEYITKKLHNELLIRNELNISRHRSKHLELYHSPPPLDHVSVPPTGGVLRRGQYPLNDMPSVASIAVE